MNEWIDADDDPQAESWVTRRTKTEPDPVVDWLTK